MMAVRCPATLKTKNYNWSGLFDLCLKHEELSGSLLFNAYMFILYMYHFDTGLEYKGTAKAHFSADGNSSTTPQHISYFLLW